MYFVHYSCCPGCSKFSILGASNLGAKETNEKAARRTVKKKKGPEGMEVIDVLFGVKHIDQFANDKVVVLRDTKGKLSLEPAVLP